MVSAMGNQESVGVTKRVSHSETAVLMPRVCAVVCMYCSQNFQNLWDDIEGTIGMFHFTEEKQATDDEMKTILIVHYEISKTRPFVIKCEQNKCNVDVLLAR